MKATNLFISVFVLLLLVACSKPGSDDLKEPDYKFEVLESKSNAPIEGAQIDFFIPVLFMIWYSTVVPVQFQRVS